MIDNLLAFIEHGFRHILPLGLDHILFVLAIYLCARDWRSLLIQVSAFTAAHTITLGLAASGVISAPAGLVEPLIALSITVVAIEAALGASWGRWRVLIVFGFGLFHGLGFASMMQDLLTGADFLVALIGFNIGVELGQLAVLAGAAVVAFGAKELLARVNRTDLYRPVFVRSVAAVIALVGAVWMVERLSPYYA